MIENLSSVDTWLPREIKSPTTHLSMWTKIQSKETQASFSIIMTSIAVTNFILFLYDKEDNLILSSYPFRYKNIFRIRRSFFFFKLLELVFGDLRLEH